MVRLLARGGRGGANGEHLTGEGGVGGGGGGVAGRRLLDRGGLRQGLVEGEDVGCRQGTESRPLGAGMAFRQPRRAIRHKTRFTRSCHPGTMSWTCRHWPRAECPPPTSPSGLCSAAVRVPTPSPRPVCRQPALWTQRPHHRPPYHCSRIDRGARGGDGPSCGAPGVARLRAFWTQLGQKWPKTSNSVCRGAATPFISSPACSLQGPNPRVVTSGHEW